ncbi:MAG: DUF177 domain-containing protein [Candidatus Euphemobacter frigidus]|nr:DUF177 domain-containing protein [Candidatus Euphemobacter frigidus]MDP8275109.1 DUF177 domain-containing protein [Candidatus Euphemobacter frigidus]
MLIDLRSIPPHGLTARGEEAPSIIDIQDPGAEFYRPIQYDLDISLAGNILLVRGRLTTVVRFTCSRCLKKFEAPLEIKDFQVQREVTDRGETIDLTDDIRTDIILAVSVKPLCQPECRGICPSCGQDLNQGSCDCSVERSVSPFAELDKIKF